MTLQLRLIIEEHICLDNSLGGKGKERKGRKREGGKGKGRGVREGIIRNIFVCLGGK